MMIMKRAGLIILFLGWTLVVGAQTGFRFVTAQIPFDFQIHGATMPAGRYDFGWGSTGSVVVRERNRIDSGRFAITGEVDENCKKTEAIVTFKQLGNQYFLKTIVYPGRATVSIFP